MRQRFVLSALFDLPFGDDEDAKNKGEENESLLGAILGHVEIAPVVTLGSGRPVNAPTGADEEQGRAYPLTSRPLGLRRNALHTPGFFNVDLRALKYFPFGERRRLDLVVESFNLFNHPNAVSINPFYGPGAMPLPTFAAPTAFAPARQVRLSIDFEF